jgi:hypothetical protein
MIEHLRRADLEHSQDEWLMRPEVSAMLSQHQAQVGAYLEMTRMDHRSFRG